MYSVYYAMKMATSQLRNLFNSDQGVCVISILTDIYELQFHVSVSSETLWRPSSKRHHRRRHEVLHSRAHWDSIHDNSCTTRLLCTSERSSQHCLNPWWKTAGYYERMKRSSGNNGGLHWIYDKWSKQSPHLETRTLYAMTVCSKIPVAVIGSKITFPLAKNSYFSS